MYRRSRLGVGYLPEPSMRLTVEQNIRAVFEVIAIERHAREIIIELLAEISISICVTSTITLSGGERRRVEIAGH